MGAGGDAAVVGEAHGIGGGGRDKSGNVVEAGIQMADTDGVVEDLEGVVVAPSEEGVAHVVAGGGDGHAGADEFMHEGEAAPEGGGAHAARAVGGGGVAAAVLEVEVTERKGDDGDPGGFDEVDGGGGAGGVLHGEGAAVAAGDGVGKFVTQDGFSGGAQALGVGEAAFIDVEVEAEAEVAGGGEEVIELAGDVGVRLGETAEGGGAVSGSGAGDANGGAGGEIGDVAKAYGLEGEAVGPFGAEFGHDGVAGLAEAGTAVEVGAEGGGAVGPGLAESEAGAGAEIGGGPVGALGVEDLDGVPELTGGVGGAGPGVGFIEVGVDVDEAGENEVAAEVGALG